MIINKEKQLKAIIEMYSLSKDDVEWMLSQFKMEMKENKSQPIIITKKQIRKEIVK